MLAWLKRVLHCRTPWTHPWNKWQSYETERVVLRREGNSPAKLIPTKETRQYRHCAACGIRQDRHVSNRPIPLRVYTPKGQ